MEHNSIVIQFEIVPLRTMIHSGEKLHLQKITLHTAADRRIHRNEVKFRGNDVTCQKSFTVLASNLSSELITALAKGAGQPN